MLSIKQYLKEFVEFYSLTNLTQLHGNRFFKFNHEIQLLSIYLSVVYHTHVWDVVVNVCKILSGIT